MGNSWPLGATKSIGPTGAVTKAVRGGRVGTVQNPVCCLPECSSHGDQIRASDRNARRPAARDRPRRPFPRPRGSAAPQSQGRMGAPAGARKRPDHGRPDLAAVRGRWPQQARRRRLDARRRPAQRRSGGARRRARGKAEHSLHRTVPLYRAFAARRARLRSRQSRQSRVQVGARHQEGISRPRRALRRGARSLHQPRP